MMLRSIASVFARRPRPTNALHRSLLAGVGSPAFMPVQALSFARFATDLAADTPSSLMDRQTSPLDRQVKSFFEAQTGKELTLASISKFIEQSLLRDGF